MKGLICISLLFMLIGCDHVVHGHVVEKQVVPAGEILMPMYMSCGKNCSYMMFIPIYYPESYVVQVYGPDTSGKQVSENLYESESEFSSIKVGDVYECGETHQCITDRPEKPVGGAR